MKKSILRDCLRISRNKICVHPEYNTYGFLHFSFFIQDNKIIELGMNRTEFSFYKDKLQFFGYPNGSNRHAELDCYFKSKGHPDFDLDFPFECVNIRLNRKGQLRNSAPCSVCAENLFTFGATHVYFTTENGFEKSNLGEYNASTRKFVPIQTVI